MWRSQPSRIHLSTRAQRAIDHFIGIASLHCRRPHRPHGDRGDGRGRARAIATRPAAPCSRIRRTMSAGRCPRSPTGSPRNSSTAASTLPFVVWEEVVDITADQAVAAATPTKKDRDRGGAVMLLLNILANSPVPVAIIEERAAACGFSKDQLKRAKQKMGVVAFKEGKLDGRWFWALPEHAPKTDAPQL